MKAVSPWNLVFAWCPIKTISGKWIWLQKCYCRKYQDIVVVEKYNGYDDYGVEVKIGYEYATTLDILKL